MLLRKSFKIFLNFLAIGLFGIISLTALAKSTDRGIYDTDNRQEPHEFNHPILRDKYRSVAALIHNTRLKNQGDSILIKGKTMVEKGYCEDEHFANQPLSATCSGFLISDDLLVTAGHCIHSVDDCKIYQWVFDYKMNEDNTLNNVVGIDQVYKCTEIVQRVKDVAQLIDFTVVRLERKVKDREPLECRKEGIVPNKAELIMMGHPIGLPLKIVDGAVLNDNSQQNYFSANLDAYNGNSGSPVFNSQTGLVEGLLVRGDADFVMDEQNNCKSSVVCNNCEGLEEITRMTVIDWDKL